MFFILLLYRLIQGYEDLIYDFVRSFRKNYQASIFMSKEELKLFIRIYILEVQYIQQH